MRRGAAAKKKTKKKKATQGDSTGLPVMMPKRERKKKGPKRQFGMGEVAGGELVMVENPDESSTSEQAFSLAQLQDREWWTSQQLGTHVGCQQCTCTALCSLMRRCGSFALLWLSGSLADRWKFVRDGECPRAAIFLPQWQIVKV
eukprot:SAG25_NODE_4514_length_799_cov_1.055714_1_plen_144_part_10